MSNWVGALWLMFGGICGAEIVAVLRVFYYHALELRPNIAPEMGLLYFPLLAVPLLLIVATLHVFLRVFFDYRSRLNWFLAGVWHAMLLLCLIDNRLLALSLLLNPI